MLESSNEFAIHRRCRKNQIDTLYNCEKGGLGGLVGKVTDFVGLTDYSGQEAALKAQQNDSSASLATAQAQLNFMKQQYADWKNVYGDIQQNLSDYYEGLSGSTIVAQQLSAQAREYANTYKQLNQSLAQKGLSNSGLAAATETAFAMQGAETRAGIRATADQQAMAQKAGFLQIGLNQQGTLLSGINSASGQVMSGYNTRAGYSNLMYNQLYNSNQQTSSGLLGGLSQSGVFNGLGGMVSSAGSSLISGIGSLFSDVRLKENIKFIGSKDGYNIYSWDWNSKAKELGIDNQPTTGVLAQELLHTDAVSTDDNGYYLVDYSKLGVQR